KSLRLCIQFYLCLRMAHTWLQSCDDVELTSSTCIQIVQLRTRQLFSLTIWNPELRIQKSIDPMKPRHRNPNYSEHPARQQNHLPYNCAISLEMPSPQAIAQHDHWRPVFSVRKAATQLHRQLCNFEKIRRRALPPDSLRLLSSSNRS